MGADQDIDAIDLVKGQLVDSPKPSGGRDPFRARAAEALGCQGDPPRLVERKLCFCRQSARSRSAFRQSPSGAGTAPACRERRSLGSVAEHARAFGLELIARGEYVIDLVAQMVHAAFRIALQELAIGELAPKGSSNSIFALGSSTNTTVTPWSGRAWGPRRRAERLAVGRPRPFRDQGRRRRRDSVFPS